MKNSNHLSILFLVFLYSCSGSDKYQGNWKAMDSKNNKFEITFSPKSFLIQDSTGKLTNYSYTQNSYNSQNSVVSYGIQLEDGRAYQIYFPKNNDESVALMKDANGVLLYTMSRKDYKPYEEVYKLN